MSQRVFVARLQNGQTLLQQLRAAMEWLDWERIIPRNSRVFIKPNLTWRVPTPGVTVTPPFLRDLVAVLRDRTSSITVGEAVGGYNSYAVEEAFQSHGLYDVASTYGIDVLNLSNLPTEEVRGEIAGQEVSVHLPSYLLHQVDVFITVPVPKVHVMTGVSLGFKNQWGCLPGAMRLRNHPQFGRKIVLINKVLNPKLAIFDGTYFLNRSGPMVGVPVQKDLLIASDQIGAGSRACCEIMRIDPASIEHFRIARREGMFPDEIPACNAPLADFQGEEFTVKRSLVNWVAFAAFHSAALTHLIYDSKFADFAHSALYHIRRSRQIQKFLYGEIGPPPGEGRRAA